MVTRINANAWDIAVGLSSELTERKEAIRDTSRMGCIESRSSRTRLGLVETVWEHWL